MSPSINRFSNFEDVTPHNQRYWSHLQLIISSRLKSFGFGVIDVPLIEAKDLYVQTMGSDSLLVQNNLFCLVGSDQELVGVLRPELTSGIARAYVEHRMHRQPKPLKLFSIGRIFQSHANQEERQEFTQLGVEVLGDDSPLTDATTMMVLWQMMQDLGLEENLVIELNSTGDRNCRSQIESALKKYYKPITSHLCQSCQEQTETKPLRLLHCQNLDCQPYKEAAPPIVDLLCANCRNHFMQVLEYLDAAGVPYDLNPSLVKGFDYYRRTVFDVRDHSQKDHPIVSGGGRYDELVQTLGGPETPAFGFGVNLNALVEKIKAHQSVVREELGSEILIIQLGHRARKKAILLLKTLSKKGFSVSMALGKESLKSQLKVTEKMGTRIGLIIGEREALDDTIILRSMLENSQVTINFSDAEEFVENKLKELKGEMWSLPFGFANTPKIEEPTV